MKTVYIYGLVDPRTNEIRYVGKTKHLLSTRLSQHISEAKKLKKSYRHKWICQLLNFGLKPDIRLLEECYNENWEETEKKWITKYRELGINLTNLTDGGECPPDDRKLSSDHIEAIRMANSGNKHCLGYKHSEEARKRMGDSRRGKKIKNRKPVSEETKRKMSLSHTGKIPSEETREKLRKAKTGKKRSEETKQKLRELNLGKKLPEEVRLKLLDHLKNPSKETREKMSKSRIGNKNALGLKHTDETKNKISEASKRSWQKRKNDKT